MKPIHVVIAAAVAYLIYRKRKGALGGDPPLSILPPTSAPGTEPDYTPWTVYAPVAPKPAVKSYYQSRVMLPAPKIPGGLPAAVVVDLPDYAPPVDLERQRKAAELQARVASKVRYDKIDAFMPKKMDVAPLFFSNLFDRVFGWSSYAPFTPSPESRRAPPRVPQYTEPGIISQLPIPRVEPLRSSGQATPEEERMLEEGRQLLENAKRDPYPGSDIPAPGTWARVEWESEQQRKKTEEENHAAFMKADKELLEKYPSLEKPSGMLRLGAALVATFGKDTVSNLIVDNVNKNLNKLGYLVSPETKRSIADQAAEDILKRMKSGELSNLEADIGKMVMARVGAAVLARPVEVVSSFVQSVERDINRGLSTVGRQAVNNPETAKMLEEQLRDASGASWKMLTPAERKSYVDEMLPYVGRAAESVVAETGALKKDGVNWGGVFSLGLKMVVPGGMKRDVGEKAEPELAAIIGGAAAKASLRNVSSVIGEDAISRAERATHARILEGYQTGEFKPRDPNASPEVKERVAIEMREKISIPVEIEVQRALLDRAAQLTSDGVVKLAKMEESRAKEKKDAKEKATGKKDVSELRGDVDTLNSMRAAGVLKQKLDAETIKAQEEGVAPMTAPNGKTLWVQVKDAYAIDKWRKERAPQLLDQYEKKVQPKIDAEKKAVDAYIAKRSPLVAEIKPTLVNNIKAMAPDMTWAGTPQEQAGAVKMAYGVFDPTTGRYVLSASSFTRQANDYKNRWEQNGSSGAAGAADGAVGFILNDLKSNIDVLIPVVGQATDSTLSQDELAKNLIESGKMFNALSAEMAERSIPKFLSGKSDPEIVNLFKQGIISSAQKKIPILQQKLNTQLAEARAKQSQRQYATLESALTAPLKRGEGEAVDRGKGVLGIDDIAAMEFGRARHRRSRT